MYKDIKVLLLNKTHQLFILFILILLIMIFEMIGLGLIPIYALLITDTNAFVTKIPDFLNFDFLINIEKNKIIFFGSLILFLTYLVKNFFLGLLFYIEGKYIKIIREESLKKLYNFFINSNYTFYINSNPSEFSTLLRHDHGLAYRCLQSYLMLFKEIIIVLIIFVLLITVDFWIYFTTFSVFLLFSSIFNFIYKSVLVNKGKILQKAHNENFKLVHQTFSSIKEVKIYQKENFFSQIFFKNIELIEKLQFFTTLVSRFPRLFLEILAIFMVSAFSFLVIFFDTKENLIALIALMAAACIRFIPAFSTITGSLNSIKLFTPSLKSIVKELKASDLAKFDKKNSESFDYLEFKNQIQLKNLSFFYPNTEKNILSNLDLTINKNDTIAITGDSGSGKTTLINIIIGFITPTKGVVKVDNKNIQNNISGWQTNISYVPQEVYLLDETLKTNIVFGTPEKQIDHVLLEKIIESTRLQDFVKSLPNGLDTNVGYFGSKISGGQKQRIGIARALYTKPEILVLDEATNALDLDNENKILDMLLSSNLIKTIIMVTHRRDNLHRFKKIYKFENKILVDVTNSYKLAKK